MDLWCALGWHRRMGKEMIDLAQYESRFRLPPYDHQRFGIQHILEHPWAALFDEMGAGKTKQTIDAAQILFHLGIIDRVLIVAPASVRSVWFDQELGELAKHAWTDIDHIVMEYHARTRVWEMGKPTLGVNLLTTERRLHWTVTNYEFIRAKMRLHKLLAFCTPKTLLVLDESSAVKNYKAQQTKACLQLRRACGRVLELNGTPIENNPGDLYSQANILHPSVLGCESWFHFRSRYGILGTIKNVAAPIIIGWQNLEDLQRRLAPYVIRRLKKDCLDLPEKLPPVSLTVSLTDVTWKIYKEMRDEMVAWLSSDVVATATVAPVKTLRLAQITAGFIGGIETFRDESDDVEEERPAFMRPLPLLEEAPSRLRPLPKETHFIGSEKQDFFLRWLAEQQEQDANIKLLVWCRFRPELFRLLAHLRTDKWWGDFQIDALHGGQKKADRTAALRAIDPRTCPKGPQVVGGTFGTGSKGLNATAIHIAVNFSYDYSLGKYLQSSDRIHRPGQVHPCSYFDLVATGPQGQRTIDHVILKARQAKEDVATWTAAAWIKELTQE